LLGVPGSKPGRVQSWPISPGIGRCHLGGSSFPARGNPPRKGRDRRSKDPPFPGWRAPQVRSSREISISLEDRVSTSRRADERIRSLDELKSRPLTGSKLPRETPYPGLKPGMGLFRKQEVGRILRRKIRIPGDFAGAERLQASAEAKSRHAGTPSPSGDTEDLEQR
jgi:hypothetical protein